MSQKVKTVTTLELRRLLGQLTDEVLYGGVWLKVTKNRNKALLVAPWDEEIVLRKDRDSTHHAAGNADSLMSRLKRVQKKLNTKNLLIDGKSWSEFVQYDRGAH